MNPLKTDPIKRAIDIMQNYQSGIRVDDASEHARLLTEAHQTAIMALRELLSVVAQSNDRWGTSPFDFDFACRDDCFDRMVPSDLRQIISARDSAIADNDYLSALLKIRHFVLKSCQSMLKEALENSEKMTNKADWLQDIRLSNQERLFKYEHSIRNLREALIQLMNRDMRNTCTHENTHRGGIIWEICDQCGAKWADDEGGKPEWNDPLEWKFVLSVLAETE